MNENGPEFSREDFEEKFGNLEEMAARDALHADHPEPFTLGELRQLVELADAEEKHYVPLLRLQALWETEIEPLPDGAGKSEIMDAYDKRAAELFAKEIIDLPEKEETANPHYLPAERLAALEQAVRRFPFARAETMERLFEAVDQRKNDLGIRHLSEFDYPLES